MARASTLSVCPRSTRCLLAGERVPESDLVIAGADQASTVGREDHAADVSHHLQAAVAQDRDQAGRSVGGIDGAGDFELVGRDLIAARARRAADGGASAAVAGHGNPAPMVIAPPRAAAAASHRAAVGAARAGRPAAEGSAGAAGSPRAGGHRQARRAAAQGLHRRQGPRIDEPVADNETAASSQHCSRSRRIARDSHQTTG